MHDFAPALTARGLDVVLAEYRGYGGSSGTPALVGMLDDTLRIADAIGVDPARLYLYGRSVGSIYALHLASQRPVAGLILESGIANVLQRLAIRLDPQELGISDEQLREAVASALDHQAKLEAYAGPVLVLHTRHDHLVPVSHAQKLARWAGDRGRLVIYERGDHNSIHYANGEAILDEVQAFVGRGGELGELALRVGLHDGGQGTRRLELRAGQRGGVERHPVAGRPETNRAPKRLDVALRLRRLGVAQLDPARDHRCAGGLARQRQDPEQRFDHCGSGRHQGSALVVELDPRLVPVDHHRGQRLVIQVVVEPLVSHQPTQAVPEGRRRHEHQHRQRRVAPRCVLEGVQRHVWIADQCGELGPHAV